MQVLCKAGFSGCDYPDKLRLQGECLDVRHIVREWREAEEKHYRVTVEDGRNFELVFSETSGRWRIISFSGLSKI